MRKQVTRRTQRNCVVPVRRVAGSTESIFITYANNKIPSKTQYLKLDWHDPRNRIHDVKKTAKKEARNKEKGGRNGERKREKPT